MHLPLCRLLLYSSAEVPAGFERKFERCYRQNQGFPGGSLVKNLPTNAGAVSAGPTPESEDPLEWEMATHSSVLAGITPCSLAGSSQWGH